MRTTTLCSFRMAGFCGHKCIQQGWEPEGSRVLADTLKGLDPSTGAAKETPERFRLSSLPPWMAVNLMGLYLLKPDWEERILQPSPSTEDPGCSLPEKLTVLDQSSQLDLGLKPQVHTPQVQPFHQLHEIGQEIETE